MKIRQLHTKIWQDDWFAELPKNSKLLFIYLLTNMHINLVGIFELSDRVICFETGLSKSELKKAKKDLEKKVLFIDGWVKIINLDKYDSFKGGKLLSAKEKQLKDIPTDISEKLDRVSIGYTYPMDTTNSNSNSNSNSITTDSITTKKSKKTLEQSLKDNLDTKKIKEIAEKYRIKPSVVKSKKDQYILWIKEQPTNPNRLGRNMSLTVQGWILRDIENGKIKKEEDEIEKLIAEGKIL